VAFFVPVAVLVAVGFSSGCFSGFVPEINSTAFWRCPGDKWAYRAVI
jgi:hypothetical protein